MRPQHWLRGWLCRGQCWVRSLMLLRFKSSLMTFLFLSYSLPDSFMQPVTTCG